MIKRFMIYGLLGWCTEVLWTGLHSLMTGNFTLNAHTSLWMFGIYGSAVFFLEPLHNRLSNKHWFLRGIIYVLTIYTIEFTSGFALRLILGNAPWHYDNTLSFMGLIRFDYAPAWFIAGIMFEFIHNTLKKYEIT